MMSRLSVERFLSMADKSAPNAPPSTIAARLVPMGSRMFFTSTCPPLRLLTATEMAMEYATRLTTSSSATTCSRVFTKSPFAPVWRMVIMVEAGAVALASAASTMENASDSPSTRYVSTNTSRLAISASVRVMNITLAPFCLSAEKRKNWPVENAMKLSATSGRKEVPSTISLLISLSPYGPMAMPASI